MIIEKFNIRQATINDVSFLVDTIIEAEKAGSDILPWSTIFGLSENETKKYVLEMLMEEVDGCELSISSFLVAEINGQVVAALSAWEEGADSNSSSQLKGNLLSYILPKDCIKRASSIYPLLREVHIEYIPGTIQKGAGYILKEFRHKGIFQLLTNEIIGRTLNLNQNITEIYTQIYGCNTSAIKANEKADFKIVMTKESKNMDILKYLPSNKKLLMKKEL